MATKIRLARRGAKKNPFYHIVAADARAPRDGKFIEKLGFYNPTIDENSNQERIKLNEERIKYWISTGAKPTDRVQRILASANIGEYEVNTKQTKKNKPKAKALEKLEAKKQAEAEKAEQKDSE